MNTFESSICSISVNKHRITIKNVQIYQSDEVKLMHLLKLNMVYQRQN